MELIGEDGNLILEETRTIEESWQGYTYFRNEDVLVAKITPCFENGKGALCQGLLNGLGFGTTELHVLRPHKDYHPKFFFYLTKSAPFRNLGTAGMYGAAGQKRVPETFINDFRTGLPSFEEQKSIVDFLDRELAEIDVLVAKKERQIELLQEKRTALISRAVTRGLDPNVPLKDSGIDWLGEIPAHWKVKRLKNVIECLDGKRIPLNSEQRSEMQGEYAYWGANGIVDYVDSWLFDEELVLLGEDGAPFFDKSKDIAFFVNERVWVNNHIHVLRPKSINTKFLAWSLNSVDYSLYVEGTTRDKLTQSKMNIIPIQFPPAEEQEIICLRLDKETSKIDALIAKIRESIERLKEFRTALISAAVTGKIDVRKEVSR